MIRLLSALLVVGTPALAAQGWRWNTAEDTFNGTTEEQVYAISREGNAWLKLFCDSATKQANIVLQSLGSIFDYQTDPHGFESVTIDERRDDGPVQTHVWRVNNKDSRKAFWSFDNATAAAKELAGLTKYA